MESNSNNYTKIAINQFFTLKAVSQLLMGDDHVLYVQRFNFTENYKRFYYKDIQSFVVRKSSVRSWLFGLFTLFILISMLLPDPVTYSISALQLLLIFINWILGPSCICHIYTAVSKERIFCLTRLKTANKVQMKLKTKIEEAQGELSIDEVIELDNKKLLSDNNKWNKESHLQTENLAEDNIVDNSRLNTFEEQSLYKKNVNNRLKFYDGKLHKITFYILALDGFVSLLVTYSAALPVLIFNTIVTLALAVLSVVSLIKQYNSTLSASVKNVCWIIVMYIYVGMLTMGIYQTAYGFFTSEETSTNPWNNMNILAEDAFYSSDFMVIFNRVCFIISISLASYGLLQLRKFNDNYFKNHKSDESITPS